MSDFGDAYVEGFKDVHMNPPLTRKLADSLYDPKGTTGLTDGDKGDVVVSGSGAVLSIDPTVATTAGRALMSAADAAAQRTALGLGGAATTAAVNRFVLWASEFIPRITNGCGVNSLETGTNRVNYDTLDFDASTQEFAQRWKDMPSNWNLGTITARFWWTAASGSGDVIWGIQARAFGDNSALDQAFGTAQTVTDTLLTAGANHISSATAAITVSGTLAAGMPACFQVYRDAAAGGDTLAVDAQLIAVEITFTPA